MATIREILRRKGSQVYTIPSSASVLEAVHYMNEHRIGAVVVADDDRVKGIFTERDVLRRVVEEQRRPAEIPIAEVMIKDVLFGNLDMSIEEASRIMKDRRIRHLPVCDDRGRLIGLISIGDLNAYHASDQEATIQSLHDYLYGSA